MMGKVRREVPVVSGLVLSAVNAVQVAAVPLPTWAHTALAVASIMAGALVVRRNVQPAAASWSAPTAPPGAVK